MGTGRHRPCHLGHLPPLLQLQRVVVALPVPALLPPVMVMVMMMMMMVVMMMVVVCNSWAYRLVWHGIQPRSGLYSTLKRTAPAPRK